MVEPRAEAHHPNSPSTAAVTGNKEGQRRAAKRMEASSIQQGGRHSIEIAARIAAHRLAKTGSQSQPITSQKASDGVSQGFLALAMASTARRNLSICSASMLAIAPAHNTSGNTNDLMKSACTER